MTPKCTRRPRQIVACTKGKCSRLSRRPRRCYHGLKLRGAPMETKAPSPQTIRFGDFELDARAGELRKKDLHILLGETTACAPGPCRASGQRGNTRGTAPGHLAG